MRKYTLYLGLNDKDTKAQKIATIEAFKIVQDMLTRHFDGATIFEATGIYRHENGEIITENTLRIELLEFDSSIMDEVRKVVSILKDVFNQESIAVQIQDIVSELW